MRQWKRQPWRRARGCTRRGGTWRAVHALATAGTADRKVLRKRSAGRAAGADARGCGRRCELRVTHPAGGGERRSDLRLKSVTPVRATRRANARVRVRQVCWCGSECAFWLARSAPPAAPDGPDAWVERAAGRSARRSRRGGGGAHAVRVCAPRALALACAPAAHHAEHHGRREEKATEETVDDNRWAFGGEARKQRGTNGTSSAQE
jgi:hypothetical protein